MAPTIELRLNTDPDADPALTAGIATGVAAFVHDTGGAFTTVQRDWSETAYLEQFLLDDRGRLDAQLFLQVTSGHLKAIRNGFVIDNPHWDAVITHMPVSDPKSSADLFFGAAWGGRAALHPNLGVLLFSTADLGDGDADRLRLKGFVIGYHLGTFLVDQHRCSNRSCVYGPSLRTNVDLADLLQAAIFMRTPPTCPLHRSLLVRSLPISQYTCPLTAPAERSTIYQRFYGRQKPSLRL